MLLAQSSTQTHRQRSGRDERNARDARVTYALVVTGSCVLRAVIVWFASASVSNYKL